MGTRFPDSSDKTDTAKTVTVPVEHLKLLGNKETTYKYDDPNPSLLETFDNPSKHPYVVFHETNEFTSLCPKTGQPDYAHVRITIVPTTKLVETKSLKLYLVSFRNYGSFMEAITNKITDDLIKLMDPKEMTVDIKFGSRGGIETRVIREYQKATHEEAELDFDEEF